MAEEKKAGDILATADFHLTGKGWNDYPVDEKVHAELKMSGAFKYCSQTCMSLFWENGNIESYYIRYERVSPENFTEFAKKLLEGMVMETVKVTVI